MQLLDACGICPYSLGDIAPKPFMCLITGVADDPAAIFTADSGPTTTT